MREIKCNIYERGSVLGGGRERERERERSKILRYIANITINKSIYSSGTRIKNNS